MARPVEITGAMIEAAADELRIMLEPGPSNEILGGIALRVLRAGLEARDIGDDTRPIVVANGIPGVG